MDSQTGSEVLREDGQTFAEMFEASLTRQDAVKEGEVVKGKIIELGKDFALIDIGYKSEGFNVRVHRS